MQIFRSSIISNAHVNINIQRNVALFSAVIQTKCQKLTVMTFLVVKIGVFEKLPSAFIRLNLLLQLYSMLKISS